MIKHYTIFASDVHIDPDDVDSTVEFIQLLTGPAKKADALYLLGDVFDAWLGDDDHRPSYLVVKEELKQLTQSGIPVYFMLGNHDFLAGRRFAKETGVTLLPDPTAIYLYGKKILLTHGDKLCSGDVQYQRYRRWVIPLLKTLPWILSFKNRLALTKKIQTTNQHHKSKKTCEIQDVTENTVLKWLEGSQADLLIHGHTHRPAIHKISLNQQDRERVALGYWKRGKEILYLSESGDLELR